MRGHAGIIRGKLRLWLPDRNPLRRAVDRVHSVIAALIFLLFLVAAPVLAITAAHKEYASGLRSQHKAQATLHRVTATVRSGTPASTIASKARIRDAQANGWTTMRASWTGPDGKSHVGLVPVPADSHAGTRITIWVTATGRQAQTPPTRAEMTKHSWLAAGLTVGGLGILLAGSLLTVRVILDRRRMTAWQSDWRNTEPRWTKQQH